MPSKRHRDGTVPQFLPLEQARAHILRSAAPLPAEKIATARALQRVLTEDVTSPADVPPFHTSAMDGYALRAEDVASAREAAPVELTVSGSIGAGDTPLSKLQPHTAVRIMTGAPVPPGADCVVPIEQVTDSGAAISVREPHSKWSCVRAAGSDTQRGEHVLKSGQPITPAMAGAMASLGIAEVAVHRRPKVAVISTGKELIAPGAELKPGQIYDANTHSLALAAERAGGIPQVQPPAADTLDGVLAALHAARDCDIVITSGGVSVGDHDFVRDAIAQLGKVLFWKVRVRPGKPLVFGAIPASSGSDVLPVIGLPGNPVSALVSFELFCRPAIRRMQGMASGKLARVQAILDDDVVNHDGREVYARVNLSRHDDGSLHAKPASNQSSDALKTLAQADGLAVCPADAPKLSAGQTAWVVLPSLPEESANWLYARI